MAYGVGRVPSYDFHFVVWNGFALFYFYGPLRAFAYAGAEAVAEQVAYEAGFTIYYL